MKQTDMDVLKSGQAKYQFESFCLEMKNEKYQRFCSEQQWRDLQGTLDELLDWLR